MDGDKSEFGKSPNLGDFKYDNLSDFTVCQIDQVVVFGNVQCTKFEKSFPDMCTYNNLLTIKPCSTALCAPFTLLCAPFCLTAALCPFLPPALRVLFCQKIRPCQLVSAYRICHFRAV